MMRPKASETKESDKPEKGQSDSSDNTVIELSQEESKGYLIKYIQPYYITGLMYTTWTSAEEIGTEKLIKFYEYNALGDYCVQLEQESPEEYNNASQWSVPAEIVEFFITYYFKVDSQYLRQAENYDAAAKYAEGQRFKKGKHSSGESRRRFQKRGAAKGSE